MIIQQHSFIGPLLPVKCGDKIIKYTSCTELLGIILDHKLSWNLQIRKACKQYGAKIKQLKKMRYLPTPLLEEICFKTVVPQISYCICMWGSCSIPLFDELDKQHLRAARVVHKMPENIKEDDILKLANWQDLSCIYKRRISTEMYKVVQGEESRLRHLFAVTNTCKGKMVEVLRPRTELGRDSLAFRGAVVWNLLDESLRNSQNIISLKRHWRKTSLN